MLRSYSDIRKLMWVDPQWWDDNGVPRYCEFDPKHLDIYARQAALLRIACQSCGREFEAAVSFKRTAPLEPDIAEAIRSGWIHYGDPPNIGCCPAGPTMNCLDLAVLEFWEREDFEWVRRPELEIDLPDAEEESA